MSVMTEDECLRRIESATRDLRRDLERVTDELEQVKVRARIAEWAVMGVAQYNVRLSIDPSMLVRGEDAVRAAELLGKNAGSQLLRGAKLAYSEHAEFYEMRAYIHHLEAHARSRGVSFRWWDEIKTERLKVPFQFERGDPVTAHRKFDRQPGQGGGKP